MMSLIHVEKCKQVLPLFLRHSMFHFARNFSPTHPASSYKATRGGFAEMLTDGRTDPHIERGERI